MICDKCKNKKICKNYDYLIEHIELTIEKCDLYYSNILEVNKLSVKDSKGNNVIELNKGPFLSPIIDNKEKELKPKEIVKCPTCGVSTYKEDIQDCLECGKPTCPSCGTEAFGCSVDDYNNIETVRYCNECYGNDYESENSYNSPTSFKDLLSNALSQAHKGDE